MRTAGLSLFLVVVAVNLLGLGLDLCLLLSGGQTITQRVWACGWLGVPILLWQAAGVAGLALHFYGD